MTVEEFILAMGRTTLFTSIAAAVAWLFLARGQIQSPRIHRAAWLLVVVQGWLLVPWTWHIVTPADEVKAIIVETFLVPTAESPEASVAQPIVAAVAADAKPWVSVLKLAAIVWLAGMSGLVVTRAWRYARFVHRVPSGATSDDTAWQAEWQRTMRVARISRPVDLCVTDGLGPLLCYVPFHYLVLVPRALWSLLSRRERCSVLRHELAHLTRGDLWKSLLVRLLALPQWFNPLVWLAVRRFDEAGEWACDDLVAGRRRDRQLVFARSLVRAGEFAASGAPGTAGLHGGRLSRRVRRLVSPSFKEETMFRKLIVLLPLVTLGAFQLVQIERVAAEEPESTATPTPRTDSAPSYGSHPYIIEVPDILAVRLEGLKPKTSYRIQSGDRIRVRTKTGATDITDIYTVDPGGQIRLARTEDLDFGICKVGGLTVDAAEKQVQKDLASRFEEVESSLSLEETLTEMHADGKFLVEPGGRIHIPGVGRILINGTIVSEARQIIRDEIAKQFDVKRVSVSVADINSKKVYLILQTPDKGDWVQTIRYEGYLTLDEAMTRVGLLRPVDEPWDIEISVHRRVQGGEERIVKIDRKQVVEDIAAHRLHGLLPGDRVIVKLPANEQATATTPNAPSASSTPPSTNYDRMPNDVDVYAVVGPQIPPGTPLSPTPLRAKPGDQVFVKRPVDAKPSVPPTQVQPAPNIAPERYTLEEWMSREPAGPLREAKQVKFSIEVIEDREDNLAEFSADFNFKTMESTALNGMLRVLKKHELVRILSSPRVVAPIGVVAHLQTGIEKPLSAGKVWNGLELGVSARPLDDRLVLDFQLIFKDGDNERRVTIAQPVDQGQSVFVPAESSPKDNSPTIYVVVTPELLY